MQEFLNGFWTFAGQYWWLIFPLMGVAGGIAKSWDRASKQRHERRMETLRLKGQIKAAQVAAKGQIAPRVSRRARPPRSRRTRRRNCWSACSPSTMRSPSAGSRLSARCGEDDRVSGHERWAPAADRRLPARKKTADALRPTSADGRSPNTGTRNTSTPSGTMRWRSRSPRRTPGACATRPSPTTSASASSVRSTCSRSPSTSPPRPPSARAPTAACAKNWTATSTFPTPQWSTSRRRWRCSWSRATGRIRPLRQAQGPGDRLRDRGRRLRDRGRRLRDRGRGLRDRGCIGSDPAADRGSDPAAGTADGRPAPSHGSPAKPGTLMRKSRRGLELRIVPICHLAAAS